MYYKIAANVADDRSRLAVLNGALRDFALHPLRGLVCLASQVTACCCCAGVLLAWLRVPRFGNCGLRQLVLVGVVWAVLAVILMFAGRCPEQTVGRSGGSLRPEIRQSLAAGCGLCGLCALAGRENARHCRVSVSHVLALEANAARPVLFYNQPALCSGIRVLNGQIRQP